MIVKRFFNRKRETVYIAVAVDLIVCLSVYEFPILFCVVVKFEIAVCVCLCVFAQTSQTRSLNLTTVSYTSQVVLVGWKFEKG